MQYYTAKGTAIIPPEKCILGLRVIALKEECLQSGKKKRALLHNAL
jgi:hypothetical protein